MRPFRAVKALQQLPLLLLGFLRCTSAQSVQAPRAATPAPSATLTLDGWLDSLRGAHGLPGMSLVVVRADSVVATAFAGVRRAGNPERITVNDRFQLGSNTKAITATMIATLVERKLLRWSSTPVDVFPELRDSIALDFRRVTLDQLLSHHAGIPPYTDTDAPEFRRIPPLRGTPSQRRRTFAAWVLRGSPATTPDANGNFPELYSNGDYAIAAAMSERVTGESWETLVKTAIFNPLQMHGTFAWSDSADRMQPWGHYETGGNGVRAVDPRDPDERLPVILWPAGAVELSANDYARFLEMNLRGLRGHDTPLLSSATITHLHTPPSPLGDHYALGWGEQDFDGAPASVHVGSAGAFYAVTVLQPTRDLGVAVFTNAGGARAAAATTAVVKALVARFAGTRHTPP